MDYIKDLDNYKNIINENKNKTLLFFCSLSFCNPCKAIQPYIEELILNNKNNDFKFFKIIVDELDEEEENKIKQILNLSGRKFPFFVFMKDNCIIYELDGKSYKELPQIIDMLQ
tara:strand:+ start:843 stop:1184 length:342 start_codon:yes stop_codon:yes gene_type:complete